MPRNLLERFRTESIREFRLAARQRQIDGDRAEEADRRTAAIYLWGYAAEMTLKAAYFSAIGLDEADAIRGGDLKDARDAGVLNFGLDWRAGNYHDVRAWAELLVAFRSGPLGIPYPDRSIGDQIEANGRLVADHWNPAMRYHKNAVRLREVELVKGATHWLMVHSSIL